MLSASGTEKHYLYEERGEKADTVRSTYPVRRREGNCLETFLLWTSVLALLLSLPPHFCPSSVDASPLPPIVL